MPVRTSPTRPLPPTSLPARWSIFDRAEKLAENEEILHRVERERLSIMYVKLMRGPAFVTERGWDYPALIDRFEVIERREKIYTGDWAKHMEKKIQGWRNDWRVYDEQRGD